MVVVGALIGAGVFIGVNTVLKLTFQRHKISTDLDQQFSTISQVMLSFREMIPV